ncbi:MAG: hypothetical protein CR972_00220 [Candidatus Moraniibacteriota bacterium]|nr:MAG: hypothetical protein CR972_00220 [Candidatus Moranbacteria bacterium]
MEKITLQDIKDRWHVVFGSVIIVAILSFIGSVFLPVKYQSSVSMIIIQKQSAEKVDAFSASKSAEFLSNVFTKVVYTTSFFNSVQEAPFDVRRDFSHDPEKREKEWEKMIDVKKVNNTSIINIDVVDHSRTTAEETAKAIAYIFIKNGEEYHGGGDRVEIRLIDGPNTPIRPISTHLIINTIIGALVGLLGSVAFVWVYVQKENEVYVENTVAEEHEENVAEEIEGELDGVVVQEHFQNSAQGMVQFDEEMNALHDRIKIFNEAV